MDYRDFKDLSRRTASDKFLHDETFYIAKNQNMMDLKEVLLQWFINFLIESLQLLENLKNEKYAHLL